MGYGGEADYVGGFYEPYGLRLWGMGDVAIVWDRLGAVTMAAGPDRDPALAEEAAIRTTPHRRGVRCHRFPRVPVDTERPGC